MRHIVFIAILASMGLVAHAMPILPLCLTTTTYKQLIKTCRFHRGKSAFKRRCISYYFMYRSRS